MFGGKYSNVLTMILVILIVAIIGILFYFGYNVIHARNVNSNALSTVDEFENATKEIRKDTSKKKDNTTEDENTDPDGRSLLDELNNSKSEEETSESEAEKVYMEGYEVKGVIEIPRTGIKYPVLDSVTKRSLEIAVGIAYPQNARLNEVGNVCIYGHNLRNGLFFSNNKKLQKNDEIYVTDEKGERVIYVVYNIYETSPTDAEYMTRDVAGRREISLQTCTDDSSGRIIVWAAEKGSM